MTAKRALAACVTALTGALWCLSAAAQSDGSEPLLQPGAPYPGTGDEVIHLHMPVHAPVLHRLHHPAAKPAGPASVDAIGAETPATTEPAVPTEAPAPVSRRTRSTHAAAAPAAPAIPFNFGEDTAPPPAGPPPAPVRTASIPPQTAAPMHAPSAHPSDDRAGLSKRGAVLFDKGVSDPSPAQFRGVKLLAGDLSTALEAGASRVQLEAYGGTPGDKSSDARRLSLKRALAVRQLLIDNGVPSNRIDVRAMGGIDDSGPTDRVDVFVRTG
jgi:outer membrane protein OmpA-like peptidoglycan-associated protein